jgi:hypothetical protein
LAFGANPIPRSQLNGGFDADSGLRSWLDRIIDRFGDRIHPVDAAIAMRAGSLLPCCSVGLPIRHFHDVLLVAMA